MPRLLIVDDEESIRSLLTRFFSRRDYEVLTAESAEVAMTTLEKNRVDAVLLDILLPGKNGLEALREIQATYPGLPVVMISGQTDIELARTTLREGAFDYVVKPFDFAYLERTVHLKLV